MSLTTTHFGAVLFAAVISGVVAPCVAQAPGGQQYAELRIARIIRTSGNQVYVSLDSDKGNEFTCRETEAKDAKDDEESVFRACLAKLLQEVAGAKLTMPNGKILIYEPLFLTALSAAGWNVFQLEDMNTSTSLGHLYYLRRSR
jgi:hypothetical protein